MSNNSNESFQTVNLLEGLETKGQINPKLRVGTQQITPPESAIQPYVVWIYNDYYNPPLNIVRRVGQYIDNNGTISPIIDIPGTILPGGYEPIELGSCFTMSCYAVGVFTANGDYVRFPASTNCSPPILADQHSCWDYVHFYYGPAP